jgi:mRNA interferase MazF
MKICQKDLVLLPFPFSDQQNSKVRPAIVVSNDYYNTKSADCILVPLTTVIKDEPYSILVTQDDLASGELLRTSRVRADKIFNIEKSIISMKIGVITEKTFDKIKVEIYKTL